MGTWITSDLSWIKNTKFLTKSIWENAIIAQSSKIYKEQEIFKVHISNIHLSLSVSRHSSLTEENKSDLERVQKAAVKVIMRNDYVDYTTSLKELYITNLVQRREKLIKNMATKITNNEKVKNMFPLRTELRSMKRRHTEKYESIKENTDRLQT